MKMTNYSSRDMNIHAAAYLPKDFQTTSTESPFQVGKYQLKTIGELSNIFYAETQIPNRDALTTPPPPLIKKSSKFPRV